MSRQVWLDNRRSHIGASDVAAILGVSSFAGPLSIYERKINGSIDEDSEVMAFGREIEGAIIRLYARRSEREAFPNEDLETVEFKDWPILAATLDGTTRYPSGESGPLEVKSVGGGYIKPREWAESPPLMYQIQLQVQMACTGCNRGTLAAMFPGYQIVWRDIDYNPDFIEAALPKLKEFWRAVEDRQPPEPTDLPRENQAVKALYPEDNGETIELDDEYIELLGEIEKLKETKRNAEKEISVLETRIRHAMGENQIGVLSDGREVTLKTTKRRGYLVEPKEYRTLRIRKAKNND